MVCPAKQQEVGVDMESMIAEFLADVACATLELPQMTTGQRKQVKKVVDGHHDLRCESYGLGQERRLHLFKKASESIDKLSESRLPLGAQFDLPSIVNCSRPDCSPPDCSTRASSSTSTPSPGSPVLTFSEMPFPADSLSDLQVRNTFIHFDDMSADQRAVQSMPHNMFAQCLLAESVGEPAAAASAAPSPAAAPVAEVAECLARGSEVIIVGLTKLPAFNGLHGVVKSFDEESGRYSILFAPTEGSKMQKLAKVKGENLRLSAPPAPRFPPTIVTDGLIDGLSSFPSTPYWEDRVYFSPPLSLTALV